MNPAAAHHRSRARRLSLFLHRWHRRIGIVASLFVIWMVVSGWLLNHTAFFHLARHTVSNGWIATRYDLRAQLPAQAFAADGHWLAAVDGAGWLDGRKLTAPLLQPVGLVDAGRVLYVADASTLLLVGSDGALIDSESSDLLPIRHIERIGRGCGGVVIAAAAQQFWSDDGVAWQPCGEAVQWSQGAPLNDRQRAAMTALVRPGVSLERLLQDLHSGRFFGAWGPFVVDAAGLAFVLLALSGLWMFSHQRQQRSRRH